MLARIKTGTLSGIQAIPIDVEVEAYKGGEQPSFTIVGMGDTAVREARERVSSALRHSGFSLPKRILVNLVPAEVRKEGSSFDLPIAIGVLVASGQLRSTVLKKRVFYGELSLDGRLQPVKGILAQTIESLRQGNREVIVPFRNCRESSLIDGIRSSGVESLPEVVSYLRGELEPEPASVLKKNREILTQKCLSEVRGQETAKRALMIAAAGSHNLLFVGVPGCGKSMLAERFPILLPPLSDEELLEVVRVHSIAGLPVDQYLAKFRPFRSPHHGISEPGLIGGGSSPRPGEISLAHHGVLFLDEFPEFKRSALEAMRSPLESGKVQITRAKFSAEFPAQFQLLAAMNPCPCGRLGMRSSAQEGSSGRTDQGCICSPSSIQMYLKKLSQPILDRIDLQVDLNPVPIEEISNGNKNERSGNSVDLQNQVLQARTLAIGRQGKPNTHLSNQEINDFLQATTSSIGLLQRMAEKNNLSARGYFRMLKVVRTVADLDQSKEVFEKHVVEAYGYRSLDVLSRYGH